MDPSNSLPGFSFASDTLKAATINRNLCNYQSPMTFSIVIAEVIPCLTCNLVCRFVAKSCRITNSQLFK